MLTRCKNEKTGGGQIPRAGMPTPKFSGLRKLDLSMVHFKKQNCVLKNCEVGPYATPSKPKNWNRHFVITVMFGEKLKWCTIKLVTKLYSMSASIQRSLEHCITVTNTLCHDIVCLFALWIRNCIAHSKPIMTSHALGGLAGSRQTLLHESNEQISRLKNLTSYKKS